MKKRARLIAFMNSYSQGKSGGDMVFIEVAKRLKDYDKVIITSLLGKELCQKSSLRGEYLITTKEGEFRNVIWTYLKRIVKAFFLQLKIEEEDVLLGTSDFLPDVIPIFWLKIKNKKTKWIQHIFHLIPSSRKIPFYSQRISLFFIKHWADKVVVDNSLLKDDLVDKFGFKSQKIVVNYPGINLKYLKSIKSPKNKICDAVFMAQLRPSKGIFDLIKIWKLVCQERPGAKLGIIGKGEREIVRKFRAEIEAVDLRKNVDLLGYLEDDRAFATIKASKIFVFPSHEEGFGIAPLEAQACGLPVVAWNLPAFEEVFPEGMIKVKTGNIEKFASKVMELIVNKQLYQKLAEEAINNARRYDWDKVAKRELYLLEKVKRPND